MMIIAIWQLFESNKMIREKYEVLEMFIINFDNGPFRSQHISTVFDCIV